jgi:hypothetical protein
MGEFSIPVELTTPNMTGQKVKDIQFLLSGNNRFDSLVELDQIKTYSGALDGIYGPLTAGATREAKNLLGFPQKMINTQFGQEIYEYLIKSPVTLLPGSYQPERAARLKALAAPAKVRALDLAITFIGIHENPPGSNEQEFGAWYGENGVPWCAIFVSYCISHISVTWKYAYVPLIAALAESGQAYMSITNSPEPGDLVTYNFPGEGPNCHIEFFETALDSSTFSAVGGNTGPVDLNDGGEVARSVRSYSEVVDFIRLSLPT